MLLLSYLPFSYKSSKETLIYGRDKLPFEDVKGHLLSKDELDNEFGSDSKADRQTSILLASKKQDKRCCYCKKLGHVKANCYKLQNKRAAESNKVELTSANLVDERSDDFLLVSMSDSSELMFVWVLDLGCSFYICPNYEWFFTYISVECGVLCMGNDSSSKVLQWSVKLDVFRPLQSRSQLVWSIGNLVIGGKNLKVLAVVTQHSDSREMASGDGSSVVEQWKNYTPTRTLPENLISDEPTLGRRELEDIREDYSVEVFIIGESKRNYFD
ncbi:hypothetical protein J1N35_022922 [Gossypium stocksii]|uniref:Retrovirus-related Pol polyprotein from transposon TNT 1-94-like beta-barrel domain-containing protein n=1 Tax=Gossypium stocksii TaxID=47602 RepID=A0A9D3VI06_9ROSI|nr:hypothetical protein J1N35_022922 [Gossypium stocksii]